MYRIMYQTLFGAAPEDVADDGNDNGDDSGDNTSFEPLFGTTDIDIIELEGSDRLVFAGEGNDLVDAAINGEYRAYKCGTF